MKIYDWFCFYICGLPEGVHISDYLWEQKQRMGGWWWIVPILTILSTFAVLGFEVWMLFHIAYYKLKGTGRYGLSGCRGRLAGQYEQDCETLAHRHMRGVDITQKAADYAEWYELDSVSIIYADINAVLGRWYDAQAAVLRRYESMKLRGQTFTFFERVKYPIDEAIELQTQKLKTYADAFITPPTAGRRNAKRKG